MDIVVPLQVNNNSDSLTSNPSYTSSSFYNSRYKLKVIMENSSKKLLILHSSMSLNRQQVQNSQRAMTLFQGKGIPFELMDGSDTSLKDQ